MANFRSLQCLVYAVGGVTWIWGASSSNPRNPVCVTCLADCVEVLIVDVVMCDNFEIVRVIFDRGFRHSGSKIQKSQFGISLDNPHYFQWIIQSLVNRCV